MGVVDARVEDGDHERRVPGRHVPGGDGALVRTADTPGPADALARVPEGPLVGEQRVVRHAAQRLHVVRLGEADVVMLPERCDHLVLPARRNVEEMRPLPHALHAGDAHLGGQPLTAPYPQPGLESDQDSAGANRSRSHAWRRRAAARTTHGGDDDQRKITPDVHRMG